MDKLTDGQTEILLPSARNFLLDCPDDLAEEASALLTQRLLDLVTLLTFLLTLEHRVAL